jgi:hypothetical protein
MGCHGAPSPPSPKRKTRRTKDERRRATGTNRANIERESRPVAVSSPSFVARDPPSPRRQSTPLRLRGQPVHVAGNAFGKRQGNTKQKAGQRVGPADPGPGGWVRRQAMPCATHTMSSTTEKQPACRPQQLAHPGPGANYTCEPQRQKQDAETVLGCKHVSWKSCPFRVASAKPAWHALESSHCRRTDGLSTTDDGMTCANTASYSRVASPPN